MKTLESLEEIEFALNDLPQADILIMILRNMPAVVFIKPWPSIVACHAWVESYFALENTYSLKLKREFPYGGITPQ